MSDLNSEAAAFLEVLGKRRDPAHRHSLSDAEWRAAFAAAGLRIAAETVNATRHEFTIWAGRAGLGGVEKRGAGDPATGRAGYRPRGPVRDRGMPVIGAVGGAATVSRSTNMGGSFGFGPDRYRARRWEGFEFEPLRAR